MRILIICGDHPRNTYFLKNILNFKKAEVIKIVLFKREKLIPEPPSNLEIDLKKLWNLHFDKRASAEKKHFNFDIKKKFDQKQFDFFNNTNDLENILKNYYKMGNKFDVCLTSGAPFFSKKILKLIPKFTVNLHLGLIPYFKGSITMFWPFYLLQPQFAGTTYHFISEYVDTGEILHNNLPELNFGDGMHETACKAVKNAADDLEILLDYIYHRLKKNILPNFDKTLLRRGKLFFKSDWKPYMLNNIYEVYNDKIVDLYLNNKLGSDKPIIKKI